MTKETFRQKCLRINPRLKSFQNTKGSMYIIITGNAKNHSVYSNPFLSVKKAWEDCYFNIIKQTAK